MLDFVARFLKEQSGIHLDYASTTPVRPEVLSAMAPYWNSVWANPSAIYKSGVRARRVIEDMREKIAHLLRIRSTGVVFTSGGTESNNLALIGTIEKLHREGRPYSDMAVLTTKIEHASILEAVNELERRGVHIVYMPLHEDGRIDVAELESCLTENVALISFAYVNSEIGVVQDVKRITRTIRAWSKARETNILVHLDAAQAPLWLPCELDMLGVDLLSLDSGKCYGPKGAGVLAFRHGVTLSPVIFGGGQEGGLRSGTENIPLIVGCTVALLRAQHEWESRSKRVALLREYFFERIQSESPGVVINGSREHRVANNVHISVPGIDSEFAVITLDRHGIAASTRSACGAHAASGSAVVRALTQDDARAAATIRFTLGEETTKKHIERAVEILSAHVRRMRAFAEKDKHE